MSKHTPGPWRWDDDVWEDFDFTERAPWLIAGGIATPILHGEMRCTSEANARLIAASPDLLEALKRALPFLEFVSDEIEEADLASAERQARAAIRKAEGSDDR